MAKDGPKLIPDSLIQRAKELKTRVEHTKKELLGYRNLVLNVISVSSSAHLSVFLAFAIDRPTKTYWIFLFGVVSVAYVSAVYFLDIYLSRKSIPS
ncbi:MAG: hypothetical protein HXS46_11630 [Theionarchaea archaeon]|nr:hypothetical protein [Theionarchaea archaeon]